MRIVVVANCQARPISAILKNMRPELDLADPIILHLARPIDAARDLRVLAEADVIFAQLTSDTFKPDHLATPLLRAAFPGKVIVWPNIFYAGQQPFLRYFTHPEGGRMLGPFEAMHDLRLYRSWLHTGRVDPEVVLQADSALVAKTVQQSLAAVGDRDALADVAVADLIDGNPHAAPMFFTFNHPRSSLLALVAERLLAKAGLDANLSDPLRDEPLGRYRVPGIDNAEGMRGDPVPADGTPQVRGYSLPDLATTFQAVYDADPRFRHPASIRLTPAIGWEHDFLAPHHAAKTTISSTVRKAAHVGGTHSASPSRTSSETDTSPPQRDRLN